MAWPLPREYRISTRYGKRGKYWGCNKVPVLGGVHTGADFAAPLGTPIYAPIAGQIRHRNYGSWAGPKQFAISPDSNQPFGKGEVFFAHGRWRLVDGTRVEIGDKIGEVASLGNSTGNHLHMEFHPDTKNVWGCHVHADPAPVLAHSPTKRWQFQNGHPVYAKYLKFDGHEQNPDRTSDSIKALQEVLNKHPLANGKTLPVSGKYWLATDAEVRKDQIQHVPPPDDVRMSYVGPKQWAHLAKATGCPYKYIPDEEPTVEIPVSGPKQWQAGDEWHAAASLLTLRNEVDLMWPRRDKSKDGTIGDARHMLSKSEHNPVGHRNGPEFGTWGCVHAIDITTTDIDAALLLEAVIGDSRVWYVIHDGNIWSKTYDWEERTYTGSDPHSGHIHVSLAADDLVGAVTNEKSTDKWLGNGLPLPEPEPIPEYLGYADFIDWIARARAGGVDLPDL